MTDTTARSMEAAKPRIVDQIVFPPRRERRLPPPASYRDGRVGAWLAAMAGGANTLWRHQTLALDRVDAGAHIVISTPTASGKSLVFQAPVIRELLNGGGVSLLLYPQKALSGDQLARWRQALSLAGVSSDLVGEINGDVPMAERNHILEHARVILATPDVIHSWLMRQVASPLAQAFLAKLAFVVIDEAHACEGVFGSNSAFFFRRLWTAAARVRPAAQRPPYQYIAATATIADPAGHLELLTGCKFEAITETDNGAPFHGLTLLHMEGAAYGAPAEKMLADTVAAVAGTLAPDGAAIAFADSRQGVEKITRAVGTNDVLPYRSGYEASDRRRIEDALRAGELRGVVSTSALELGIDIPQFVVGLNLGVPQTRKAFRQRVGRIGRSAPGIFAVIAPAPAFAQLGVRFAEFYAGEVEPSHLYLENRYIQFQQARCLVEEIAPEDGVYTLPEDVSWPDGFAESFAAALPGAVRSRELDAIAAIGADSPHLTYPLRKIGDVTYALRLARGTSEKIGTIDIEKAMREAYPGATYFHLKRPYRVVEWRTKSYEHLILLEPTGNGSPTRPMLRTGVNISLDRDGLIDGRHLANAAGCIAEVAVGVHESVEGYIAGTTPVPYREASKTDSRLSRKQREFSSTGVVLRIDAPWFKGAGDHQVAARRALAGALETLLSRTQSIAPGDIRSAHCGIALRSLSGPRKIDDAIVVFDTTQGGLRLTGALFDALPRFLEQLSRGAEMAGEEALISASLVDRVMDWYTDLKPALDGASACPANPGGDLIIFAPQSEVGLRVNGALVHRRLLEPQIMMIDDEQRLMYRYESSPGVHAFVAHDRCEPVGQDWRRVLWNPVSNALREVEA